MRMMGMFDRQQYQKNVYSNTDEHIITQIPIVYNIKTDHITFVKANFCKSRGYNGGSKNNKKCPSFLGVHVAEKVLSKVFKNVERMPVNNRGYDFICNKGYKIDVKSATILKNRKAWLFNIHKNVIPDYFLCLAFDNRKNLNPLHIWLIPSEKICDLIGWGISNTKLNGWSKYELSDKIDDIITCCDIIKKD